MGTLTMDEKLRMASILKTTIRNGLLVNSFKALRTRTQIYDQLELLMKYYKKDPMKALGVTDYDSLDYSLIWWRTTIKDWTLVDVCSKQELIRVFEEAVLNLQRMLSESSSATMH